MVVLATHSGQGVISSSVRQGELQTVLILLDELSQTAPDGMQHELRKLVTRLQAALPQLVLFAPALDELQASVSQALSPQALHLLAWAGPRRAILGPSSQDLLKDVPPAWRPLAEPSLPAWDGAVRARSAVENWHRCHTRSPKDGFCYNSPPAVERAAPSSPAGWPPAWNAQYDRHATGTGSPGNWLH